ncbi:DUF979 domain-containing protein [Undibacterium sp. RuRC25W]|uniref:DUF979 domain-containing protein n=1 Tax=Undibacterium sp. RuRC25W TaxID=3413047 RepID=UPI003BF10056
MNSIFNIHLVFYVIGFILLLVAGLTWRDVSNPKRWATGFFWLLFSSSFLLGDLMVAQLGKPLAYRINGVIVLLLALIAGFNFLGVGKHRFVATPAFKEKLNKIGMKIFLPALSIPLLTVILTLFGKTIQIGDWYLFDQSNLTLAALILACLCALAFSCFVTGGTPLQAVRESRRLIDALGWALVLPQLLAMLGGVFVAAHTGQAIQHGVSMLVNPESRLGLVIAYCVGMAVMTMIMGNGFAAFPIMTAGIALPFLIIGQHANPAAVVAIGMFSGYCGTLMTPMAANYNIVPAALLELKDKYLVIKTQIPTALLVLACNVLLMYFLAFPH